MQKVAEGAMRVGRKRKVGESIVGSKPDGWGDLT
jgi:hypothetical protein